VDARAKRGHDERESAMPAISRRFPRLAPRDQIAIQLRRFPGQWELALLQDRALSSGGIFGRIAQLVEQLTLNQRVPGSSPGAPTNRFKYLRGFPAVIATSHQGLAMFCGLLVKSCESIQALADQAKEIGVPGIRRLVVECVLKRAVIRSNAPGAAR
jgi:hypothetical protein